MPSESFPTLIFICQCIFFLGLTLTFLLPYVFSWIRFTKDFETVAGFISFISFVVFGGLVTNHVMRINLPLYRPLDEIYFLSMSFYWSVGFLVTSLILLLAGTLNLMFSRTLKNAFIMICMAMLSCLLLSIYLNSTNGSILFTYFLIFNAVGIMVLMLIGKRIMFCLKNFVENDQLNTLRKFRG